IKTEEKELIDARKAYVEKINKLANTFDLKKDAQNLEKISLIVTALTDKDQKVRETSIKILTSLTKDSLSYNASLKPENQIDAIKKWKDWLESKVKNYEVQKELLRSAYLIKTAGKIKTAFQVGKIKLLVDALNSSSLEDRKIAFSALSEYARKHVSNEVREDFAYDPSAPEKVRSKPIADWKKWFTQKVIPVAQLEEKKISNIKTWGNTLNSKFSSLEDLNKVSQLVSYLEDHAFEVRELAIKTLVKLSGEDYGFQAEKSILLQKDSLELWKIWLKIKGENIKPVPKVKKVEAPKKAETSKK
ncbi:hypothetical protein KKC45_00455, partial [Patescibacteria group bacterium]|nr:hypothetical protein [Patescibacteria group bacterium]